MIQFNKNAEINLRKKVQLKKKYLSKIVITENWSKIEVWLVLIVFFCTVVICTYELFSVYVSIFLGIGIFFSNGLTALFSL